MSIFNIKIDCKIINPIILNKCDDRSKVNIIAIKFKIIYDTLNFVNFYYIGWYGVNEYYLKKNSFVNIKIQ